MSLTNEMNVTAQSTDGIVIEDVTADSLKKDLEDLELRYLMFCEKNELDEDLQPDEQYDLSESQQRWIDNHLNKFTSLNIQLLTMSDGAQASKPTFNKNDENYRDEPSFEAVADYNQEAQLAFQLM